MKNTVLCTVLGAVLVTGFTFLAPSLVETAYIDTSEPQVMLRENPTIRAAVELAKSDSETWSAVIADMDDSGTLLVLPEGEFLQGEMKNSETNESWNSDTDPNAATLREIKSAILANDE